MDRGSLTGRINFHLAAELPRAFAAGSFVVQQTSDVGDYSRLFFGAGLRPPPGRRMRRPSIGPASNSRRPRATV